MLNNNGDGSTHPLKLYNALSVPFNPVQISGCALWLDAAQDRTSNNSFINTIPDKSVSGYSINAVTNNTVTILTNQLNGLPVYNLGTTRMQIANFTWRTRFTAILLLKCQNANSIISLWNTGYVNFLYFGNYDLIYIKGYDIYDSVGQQTKPPGIAGQWVIGVFSFNGVALPPWRLNGSSRSTTYFAGTIPADGTDTATLFINGNGNSSTVFDNTQIAEILFYNDYLPILQQQQIEGYLAWKWGLRTKLPTTHPYYKFNPA